MAFITWLDLCYKRGLFKTWYPSFQRWKFKHLYWNYLKNIESMRDKSDDKNSEYSGYFWFNKKNKLRHAQMRVTVVYKFILI